MSTEFVNFMRRFLSLLAIIERLRTISIAGTFLAAIYVLYD